MLRKKKNYLRPRQIYQAGRIKEENILVKKYGLKNKTEIWKSIAKVTYYRHRAKAMARLPLEEQEILFAKLRYIGLDVKNTADVLGLKVEDILERRLSTVVAKKKLANTPQQARQMIVHKRILLGGKAVSSPSYLVPVSMETAITIKQKNRKPKPAPESSQEAEQAGEEQVEEGE